MKTTPRALLLLCLAATAAHAQAPPAPAELPARLAPMARFKKWKNGLTDFCARKAVQYYATPDEDRPTWVYAWAFEGTFVMEGDCSFAMLGQVFSAHGDDTLLNACPGGLRDIDFDDDGHRDLLVYSQDCAAGPLGGDTIDLCLDRPGGPACQTVGVEVHDAQLVRRSGRVILQMEFLDDTNKRLSGDYEDQDLRWVELSWDGHKLVELRTNQRPPAAVPIP
jgi:hypothetical protein